MPDFFFPIFPCSADHERDWPPCKVVFFGLATNALNVRNNNNSLNNNNNLWYAVDNPVVLSVELTHLVVKWSAVRNQSEIETSLKMRGMSSFISFVKLVQQRRTQNHADFSLKTSPQGCCCCCC